MPIRRWGSMTGIVSSAAIAVAGLLLAAVPAQAQDSKIPKRVMDALTARFPQAEIRQWTREEEDGLVLYDIEFTQQGRKLEADIVEDGRIHNWEREIAADDLPGAVKAAVGKKYPGATLREIMAITAVSEGTEALEGYEVVLRTAEQKEIEVTLAPDGRFLEEPGGSEPGPA